MTIGERFGFEVVPRVDDDPDTGVHRSSWTQGVRVDLSKKVTHASMDHYRGVTSDRADPD